MVFADPSDVALEATITSINGTIPFWRLGPLSSKWIYVNGSIPKNTYVNGHYYDGSINSINDTIIIQRKEIRNIGTLPLSTFVYLIVSIVVIMALLAMPSCRYIFRLLLGNDKRFGTDRTNGSLSEYAFDRQLREFYPPPGADPLPSYPELVDYDASNDVTSTNIRDCQSMIRKVYALKVDAYNARDVRRAHQDMVAGWKMQATAGLRDVQGTVERWAQRTDWSTEEKRKVDEIRARILTIQPEV